MVTVNNRVLWALVVLLLVRSTLARPVARQQDTLSRRHDDNDDGDAADDDGLTVPPGLPSMDGRSACSDEVLVLTALSNGSSFGSAGRYPADWVCYWRLVASGANHVVMLVPHSFDVECGWDYLHVYDGPTTQWTRVAAYCGNHNAYKPHRVIVSSNKNLLAAFSADAAYEGSGFSIDFYDAPCPVECRTSTGGCDPSSCQCWRDNNMAPIQCSHFNSSSTIQRRAGHTTVLDPSTNSLFVLGGYNFGVPPMNDFHRYSLASGGTWSTVPFTSEGPIGRWGHASALIGRSIYVFGGMDSTGNELDDFWCYSIESYAWKKIKQAGPVWPAALTATTLTAVDDQNALYLICGYSSRLGYSSRVYSYNVERNSWNIINKGGAQPFPLQGHSAVYHQATRSIYVYGGLRKYNYGEYSNRAMLVLSITTGRWEILYQTEYFGLPAVHHGSTMLGNLVVISSGYGVSDSDTDECITNRLNVFDTICRRWYNVTVEPNALPLSFDLRRMGHTLTLVDDELVVIGGFSGEFLGDVVTINSGAIVGLSDILSSSDRCIANYCKTLNNCDACQASNDICAYCVVNGELNCVSRLDGTCSVEMTTCMSQNKCLATNCYDCDSEKKASGDKACAWCDNYRMCIPAEHANISMCAISTSPLSCPRDECQRQNTCSDCALVSANTPSVQCNWCSYTQSCDLKDSAYLCNNQPTGVSESSQCATPCSDFIDASSCHNSHRCMWCDSENTCLGHDNYIATFPYGQCFRWTTTNLAFVNTQVTTTIEGSAYQEYSIYLTDGSSDLVIQVSPKLTQLSITFTNQENGRTWSGMSPLLGVSATDPLRSAGRHLLRIINPGAPEGYSFVVKYEPRGTVPTVLAEFPEQPYADFGIDMLYFITFFSVFLFVFLLMAIVMKKGYDYYRLRRLQEEYIRAYQNRFIAPTGAVNIVDKNDLLMPWRPNASLKPLSLEFARKEDMQVTAATYICLLPWDRDVETNPPDVDIEYPPLAFATAFMREQVVVKTAPSASSTTVLESEEDDLSGPQQQQQQQLQSVDAASADDGEGYDRRAPTSRWRRAVWTSVRDYFQVPDEAAESAAATEDIQMEDLSSGWQDSEGDRLMGQS